MAVDRLGVLRRRESEDAPIGRLPLRGARSTRARTAEMAAEECQGFEPPRVHGGNMIAAETEAFEQLDGKTRAVMVRFAQAKNELDDARSAFTRNERDLQNSRERLDKAANTFAKAEAELRMLTGGSQL